MVILIYKMTEIVRAVIGQRTYGLLYRLTPCYYLQLFYKSNRPHFLCVSQCNKPIWGLFNSILALRQFSRI